MNVLLITKVDLGEVVAIVENIQMKKRGQLNRSLTEKLSETPVTYVVKLRYRKATPYRPKATSSMA